MMTIKGDLTSVQLRIIRNIQDLGPILTQTQRPVHIAIAYKCADTVSYAGNNATDRCPMETRRPTDLHNVGWSIMIMLIHATFVKTNNSVIGLVRTMP